MLAGYQSVLGGSSKQQMYAPGQCHWRPAGQSQRRWRVLMSIGLLLPALAAIIGIVAWTISLEVANSASHARAHHAHRSHEFRHSQAGAPAPQHQPFRRHQPAAEQQLYTAAAVSQQQPSQQQPKPHQQHPHHKSSSQGDSAVLLTSMEQVEALSGSSSERPQAAVVAATTTTTTTSTSTTSTTTSTTTARPTRHQQSGALAESDEPSEAEAEAELESESEPEAREKPAKARWTHAKQMSSINKSFAGHQTPSGGKAQRGRLADVRGKKSLSGGVESDAAEEAEGASALAATDATDDQEPANNNNRPSAGDSELPAPASSAAQMEPASRAARPRRPKSQSLLAKASLGSRKSSKSPNSSADSDSGSEEAKLERAAPSELEEAAPRPARRRAQSQRQLEAERRAAANSRYLMVAGASEAPAELESEPEPESEDAKPAVSVSASSSSRGEAVDETELAAATRASNASEEELKLEEVASAISSSLNEAAAAASIERVPSGSGSAPTASARRRHAPGDQFGTSSEAAVSARRRSAGEHVAEVIDHLVERRKQASGPAAGSSRSPTSGGAGDNLSPGHGSGPQIVVVAPVGGAALLSARSLVKEPSSETGPAEAAAGAKASKVAKKPLPGADSASAVAGSKKPAAKRWSRPLGARLLGSASPAPSSPSPPSSPSSSPLKPAEFSERVEVIQDDDSSALLAAAASPTAASLENEAKAEAKAEADAASTEHQKHVGQQSHADEWLSERKQELLEQRRQQLEALRLFDEQARLDEPASIHVSSQPGEARLRAPRHEIHPSAAFERYQPASLMAAVPPREPLHQAAAIHQAPAREQLTVQGQQQQQQPRLYSAEALIREHVLRARSKAPSPSGLEPSALQASLARDTSQAANTSAPLAAATAFTSITNTTTTSSTTSSPPALAGEPRAPRQRPDQPRQAPPMLTMQSVQVPVLMKGAQQHQQPFMAARPFSQPAQPLQQLAQPAAASMDAAAGQQALESQLSAQFQQPAQRRPGPASSAMQSHQSAGFQPQQQQQPQQPQQLQQAQASSLPVFADQEISVPAHLAESVINDIQRSPSTISFVDGRPTLVSNGANLAMAASNMVRQVPPSPFRPGQAHQAQQPLAQQPFRHHQFDQGQQAQPMRQPAVFMAGSQSQPVFLAPRRPAPMMAVPMARPPLQVQSFAAGPVLANRDGGAGAMQKVASEETAASGSSALKLPRGLVDRVGRVALRNLLSSFGQQAQQQQAELDARQQARSSAGASASPPTGEQMQAAGSGSVPSAVVAPPEMGARAMRSLAGPSGQASPAGDPLQAAPQSLPADNLAASSQQHQQQQMVQLNDQEVQESYGQMPAYHMAGYPPPPPPPMPHYGGGGGGGGGYQEQDQKSKGITFHFGGGPIGGGTQLITSPMGIFKHLMIPLLPNPRVNLNGKVVFGVVLEKSTAFGAPPKKKLMHKFWGK